MTSHIFLSFSCQHGTWSCTTRARQFRILNISLLSISGSSFSNTHRDITPFKEPTLSFLLYKSRVKTLVRDSSKTPGKDKDNSIENFTRNENINTIGHFIPFLVDTCKIGGRYSFLYLLSKPRTFLHHKDIACLQLEAWRKKKEFNIIFRSIG